MQSIVVLGGLIVLGWILPFTLILLPVAGLVWVAYLVFWLLFIYKAWSGEEWEVPVLGKVARQLLAKA